MRACPGQIFQMTLRGLAWRHRLVRILIFELVERKHDAAGKPHGFRDRLRQVAEQPRHFIRGLEMTFGIGFQAPANGLDGGLLANAGQDILQGSARRMVIQHLVGGEQRHACRDGEPVQPHQAAPVIAAIQQACRKPHAIGAAMLQPIQHLARLRRLEAMRQRQDQKLSFGEFQEIIEMSDGIRPSRCRRCRACRG